MFNKSTNYSLFKRAFSTVVFKKAQKPLELVTISINDLQSKERSSNVMEKIEKAYSKAGGLGAVLVSGIPGLREMNEKIGRWTYRINNEFTKEEQEAISRPDLGNVMGYSLGNITVDEMTMSDMSSFNMCPLHEKFTLFDPNQYEENIWPKNHPGLKQDLAQLTSAVVAAEKDLLRHIDFYVDDRVKGKRTRLEPLIDETSPSYSRQGYHFPRPHARKGQEWLAWHQDYTYITSLCKNVCFDKEGRQVEWDPEDAGLYAMNAQTYEVQKYRIPDDCLCIQASEMIQILSGGEIMSTPHAVLAQENQPELGRAVYVHFAFPQNSVILDVPEGKKPEDAFYKPDYPLYSMTHLGDRWTPGETCGEFLASCTKTYYGVK